MLLIFSINLVKENFRKSINKTDEDLKLWKGEFKIVLKCFCIVYAKFIAILVQSVVHRGQLLTLHIHDIL